MRRLIVTLWVLATSTTVLRAQTPAPAPLDWWSADSSRVAFVTGHGHAIRYPDLILWVPTDSLDPIWFAHFADSLASSVGSLKTFLGGPYPWQRIADRPIVFILSPGQFISHATGQDTVFISLNHLRRGWAPFLHEAAHELLAPPAPFWPYEYPDSLAEARSADRFPQWLNEGMPDFLAQAVAEQTGFREGDVFAIGGLTKVDSTCAARLSQHPHRAELLAAVGGLGRVEALFAADRSEVAPAYYACSQSLTKYLVGRIGVHTVVGLFPNIPAGTWLAELSVAAGAPLPALQQAWWQHLGLTVGH